MRQPSRITPSLVGSSITVVIGLATIVLVVMMHSVFSFGTDDRAVSVSQQYQRHLAEEDSIGLVRGVALDDQVVGSPVRLQIPKIKVDAAVEYVGLTPEGSMGVPKSQKTVAWLALGQRPGELGTAVIAGHYGWWVWQPSVFDKLHKLRKGDKIYVKDDAGVTSTFVEQELRRLASGADATDVFSANDGRAHLNLITCEGFWKSALRGYPERLVVFTVRE